MSQTPDDFEEKPAVLRCGRCGKFVDWADAQVQIVCSCRPHIDLPPVLVHEATDQERPLVRALFQRDFGRRQMVRLGEVMNLDEMPALVATMHDDVAGALAYRLLGDGLHVVALATDPMWQRTGVGGHLIAEAGQLMARRLSLSRIVVTTTNDNLPALYFYQRRGYRLEAIAPGVLCEGSSEPVRGFAGIPVRDEVRLEKLFG